MAHITAWYIYEAFRFFFVPQQVLYLSYFITAYLPDSRAGTSRLLKPLAPPALLASSLGSLPYQDIALASLHHILAYRLRQGQREIRTELIKPLLEELNCKDLEVVFEYGTYIIYVRTWTDKRLPLFRAPSGIRETILTALALTSCREPYLVIIEEPEAHLHPRAQRVLARIIARAVNELGKTVILTTHSDTFLYSIENLIMASEIREEAKKLGLDESEILDPDKVAVYLVRPEDTKAVVERLEVTPEGVPEEEFAKVMEELSEERARIVTLSRRKKRTSEQAEKL